jgi:nucleotide-binding universal stress UspA family protein
MVHVLLPVDGSKSATRATEKLVETFDWYKARPQIDLFAVALPVPRFPHMGVVVSPEMIERYYADEFEAMLAPSKKILDAAGAKYTVRTAIGSIAECIVEQAGKSGSNMIYMGTRGMTALSNMVLGSVTTRVLHLARIPVVLIH